jgi:transcriptional regulator with XRE-family HTH domain
MNPGKRKALEAAGWRFGDAADFLGMTDEERQLLDARSHLATAVRQQRQRVKLSQKELARRINTSQPRVVKIERGATDVSLDQILRAFSAAGGQITVKQVNKPATKHRGGKSPRSNGNRATVIELTLGQMSIAER